MNEFKIGDIVICINDLVFYGGTTKSKHLTRGNYYKVLDSCGGRILISSDTGINVERNADRFKLAKNNKGYLSCKFL